MTSRVQRLWFPGDGRPRVFLPDFWLKLLEPHKAGYMRLPKNAAMFEVDSRMSRLGIFWLFLKFISLYFLFEFKFIFVFNFHLKMFLFFNNLIL